MPPPSPPPSRFPLSVLFLLVFAGGYGRHEPCDRPVHASPADRVLRGNYVATVFFVEGVDFDTLSTEGGIVPVKYDVECWSGRRPVTGGVVLLVGGGLSTAAGCGGRGHHR